MKKLLVAVALWAGLVGAGWARTVEQQLLASLRAQGYVILEQGYTFLGRLRVVAENGEFRREIVVNPGTGEILRDYAIMLPVGVPSTHGLTPGSGRTTGVAVAGNPTVGGGTTAATAGMVGIASVGSDDGQTATGTTSTNPDDPTDGSGGLPTQDDGALGGLLSPDLIVVDPILPFSAEEP